MKSEWNLYSYWKMDIMRKNTSYFAYLTIPLDNEYHNSFLHTLWSRTIQGKNGNIPPLSLQPQMQFICFSNN